MKTVLETTDIDRLDNENPVIQAPKNGFVTITITRTIPSSQIWDLESVSYGLIGKAHLVDLAVESYQLGQAKIELSE